MDITSGLLGIVPGIIIWDQYVDFLKWFLDELSVIFRNGGIAIIIFTIVIKTLMLPLTVKSIRSSKAMQDLAPKIKEIQKKHGKDRQAASAAQMSLYQQYGVNPMAGCLPMLIQMPIFFGVYRAILPLSESGEGHWADGFLWLSDLGEKDPYFIMPVLAGLFQFVQARMMRPANQVVTDPQQKMMNTMMNFMPFTVIIFGATFASGAVLYWVAQAIYSVVQQWFITGWGAFGVWFPWLPEMPEHRRLGYVAPKTAEEMAVQSSQPPKQGKFAQWMAKQQEMAQQKQAEAQSRRDEVANAEKANKPAGTAAPAGSAKRSDYQSRVDAASKLKKNGADAAEEPAETQTRAATTRTTNQRRKKKKKA